MSMSLQKHTMHSSGFTFAFIYTASSSTEESSSTKSTHTVQVAVIGAVIALFAVGSVAVAVVIRNRSPVNDIDSQSSTSDLTMQNSITFQNQEQLGDIATQND